jgi:glucokinase
MHIGAVDIGGTKIAVGVVDENGRVLARTECPTEAARGPADGIQRMAAMLDQTRAQVGGALAGIGIGSTGPVDPLTGEIGDLEFLPGWQGANPVHALADRFGLPAAIENDADAVALAEARWGVGRGVASFIYVTVSTGIGGGLVFNGRLYRGVGGAHPEVGHHVIDPAGPACPCGARGCWESLASGPALSRWYTANTPGAPDLDARAICAAAARGDPHAQAAVEHTADYLGLGLANLITLFTPDVIALGGGLMRSRHLFWDRIEATIGVMCKYVPAHQVQLVPTSLGSEAGLIGAACVWLHRFQSAG